jgi:hypothetical protein
MSGWRLSELRSSGSILVANTNAHGQLIITAVSLAEGVDDGAFVNGPYNHDLYEETVHRIHAHLGGWNIIRCREAGSYFLIRA